MADIMNLVWDRLLPAMGDEPLAEDPEAQGRLKNRLESLSIPLPSSALNAGEHEKWLGRTWKFEENPLGVESLSLHEEGDDSVLAISTSDGTHEIRSSSTRWVAGETELPLGATAAAGSKQENRIAVSGAWTAESVFSVHLAFTEAPRRSRCDAGLLPRTASPDEESQACRIDIVGATHGSPAFCPRFVLANEGIVGATHASPAPVVLGCPDVGRCMHRPYGARNSGHLRSRFCYFDTLLPLASCRKLDPLRTPRADISVGAFSLGKAMLCFGRALRARTSSLLLRCGESGAHARRTAGMHAPRPKGGGQDGPRKISSQKPQSGQRCKLQPWTRGISS